MARTSEELIDEASFLYGGFEGLLEKLPYQASALRLIRGSKVKMSDRLTQELERLIEARREVELPAPVPALAEPLAAADFVPPLDARPGGLRELDHPEVVSLLFDEVTAGRLNRLAAVSRLTPAQLIRVATLRYMDHVEETGEIVIRFSPKTAS